MAKARFRIKMTRNQIPFEAPKNVRNPFEGRITQQELDEGFFVLGLDEIAEIYSDGQIETLMEEMRLMSDEYENECIERLLAAKK